MIMRKVFLGIIFLEAVLFSSCSNMEDKADKNMDNYIKEIVKNPTNYQIVGKKKLISNDSICIYRFILKGENGFGGWSSSNMQYELIKKKIMMAKINIMKFYMT
jgi:hypothetical protein